jgi:hypothetical protein
MQRSVKAAAQKLYSSNIAQKRLECKPGAALRDVNGGKISRKF